jgi:drug/metabolite transporter (DMT)-like permease
MIHYRIDVKTPVSAPAWALLVGAALWGVMWYPFRLLAAGGLDGIWSTVLAYGVAFVVGSAVFPRDFASLRRMPWLAVVMGLAIGLSNLGYVVGVLEGEVMRVLLLFYLAPLWTVPFARLLLGERLDAAGAVVMTFAMAGAGVMLWRPELGAPWPASLAEWLGVGSGILFALGNVLVRRLDTMTDAAKSIVVWAGVAVSAAAHLPLSAMPAPAALSAAAAQGPLLAGIGVALVAMSYSIQYGLARIPANRAIVILLFELVVAAVAAYYLAGETLRAQDWIGGAFIVLACVASSRAKAETQRPQRAQRPQRKIP